MSRGAARASTDLTTGALARQVGARCDGPATQPITGVAPLDDAGPGDLAFCAGGRWRQQLASTRAGAVLVAEGLPVPDGVVALRTADPRRAFARAAALIRPMVWPAPGVHPSAVVDPTATVSGATIGPLAVIGPRAVVEAGAWIQAHAFVGEGARIGAGSRLMPHAVVLEGCVLGRRVWLQPGAVVGADGFGQVPGEGTMHLPQLGTVRIDDDVHIGANACVDRAALGATTIGTGTRIDNLVQIAHGVRVGAECLLAAFVGIAGSTSVGDRVHMGARSGVIEGRTVGDGARLAALASATRDVPPDTAVGGVPARGYRQWLREVVALGRLPGLLRDAARAETDDAGP